VSESNLRPAGVGSSSLYGQWKLFKDVHPGWCHNVSAGGRLLGGGFGAAVYSVASGMTYVGIALDFLCRTRAFHVALLDGTPKVAGDVYAWH